MRITYFERDGFTVSVFTTIEDVRQRWQHLIPSHHHLNFGYLKSIEESGASDLGFRYLVIQKDDEAEDVAGLCYFQLLRFSENNIRIAKRGLLGGVSRLFLRLFPAKILIAGNVFAVDFPAVHYDRSKISLTSYLGILSAYFAASGHTAMVVKDLPPEFSPDLMDGCGFEQYAGDLTMTLDVRHEWNTFDDYVKALTKKYAQRAVKVRRSAGMVYRRELSVEDILLYRERLEELYRNVASKQVIRMGIVGWNYFYVMAKNFSGFTITAYFLNTELIAFVSYIDHEDGLEVHYIGIDYSYNEQYRLYFNILFDGVEKAIQMRRKQLELGRTAREAKAIIGCHPVVFNDYLLIRGYFRNKVYRYLKEYFKNQMGDEWKRRNPFRRMP